MPVLKVKKDGIWEKLGGTSPADGGNADMLDGRHADYFATVSDVNELKDKVDNGVKTLSEHLTEEMMILSNLQYGDKLPGEDGEPYTHVEGRIFFKRVVE